MDADIEQKLKDIETQRTALKKAEAEVKDVKEQMKKQLEVGLELLNDIKDQIVQYRKLNLLGKMTKTRPLVESINERTTAFLKENKEETKQGTHK